MTKILFMMINMNVGGMEKALLNMISEMDNKEYEVTILMLEKYGGFLEEIPSWVNIQYLEDYNNIKPMLNYPPKNVIRDLIKNNSYLRAFNLMIMHIITKLIDDRTLFYKYVFKDYKSIEDIYDIAVAYAGPTDYITYYVLNKINAKRKFQWIHFDITKVGFNRKFARNNYKRFDKIFIVSEEAKEKLINCIPELSNNMETFKNIVSKNNIFSKINNQHPYNDNFKGIRLITVGRLSKEKGQDILIPIVKRLNDDGYNIRWYCIGEGNLRKKCEELILKYGVGDKFILLGNINNPYNYINASDIYVQSSRHEGYCIALAEAKILNKPIVTTNFAGAKEQIINNKTGLISECNENDIYNNIKKLLDSEELRNRFKKNLKYDMDNYNNDLYKLKM